MPVGLDEVILKRELQTERYGRSLELLSETESTNDDARRAAEAGARSGHVVIAECQSNGRGARGRRWTSPAGTDLYMSIVERATVDEALPLMTLAVGLGVSHTVERLAAGHEVQVKWPNDVLLNARKCSGILCEAADGVVVLGVGLNVNRSEWPQELEGQATSLAQEIGTSLARETVCAELLGAIEKEVARWKRFGGLATIRAAKSRLAWVGKEVRCESEIGIFEGIASDGAAFIRNTHGVRKVYGGNMRLS